MAQETENSDAGVNEQTVNDAGFDLPLEYSSLEAQPEPADSSPQAEQQPPDGGLNRNEGQDPRSPYIPRERFDQVHRQGQEAQQQLQSLQQQYQQLQAQLQHLYQPQPQIDPRLAQQGLAPSGMQYQAPQTPQPQQQPQGVQLTDEKAKEWQERIANGGPKALAEFIMEVGAPLVQQQLQAVQQEITPLRLSYLQQAVSSYEQSRSSDPSFQQIRPIFQQMLQRAHQLQPHLQPTPQNLQAVEFVARQAAAQYGVQVPNPFLGQPVPQPQSAQPAPFTERPGAVPPQGARVPRTLTPKEMQVARQFGLSPAEYLAGLGE